MVMSEAVEITTPLRDLLELSRMTKLMMVTADRKAPHLGRMVEQRSDGLGDWRTGRNWPLRLRLARLDGHSWKADAFLALELRDCGAVFSQVHPLNRGCASWKICSKRAPMKDVVPVKVRGNLRILSQRLLSPLWKATEWLNRELE
jgi:hypothetical protein